MRRAASLVRNWTECKSGPCPERVAPICEDCGGRGGISHSTAGGWQGLKKDFWRIGSYKVDSITLKLLCTVFIFFNTLYFILLGCPPPLPRIKAYSITRTPQYKMIQLVS